MRISSSTEVGEACRYGIRHLRGWGGGGGLVDEDFVIYGAGGGSGVIWEPFGIIREPFGNHLKVKLGPIWNPNPPV